MAGSRQGSLAKHLSLLFLTPCLALSSHQHRTLVCLFWSGNLHCTNSPANPYCCSPKALKATGCIQQLKPLFLQHLVIPGFPKSDHFQNNTLNFFSFVVATFTSTTSHRGWWWLCQIPWVCPYAMLLSLNAIGGQSHGTDTASSFVFFHCNCVHS